MDGGMLAPVAALVLWTFVMFGWMFITRLPAMQRAGLEPQTGRHTRDLDSLPTGPRSVADNYNHLHEQPTLFYAVALASQIAGLTDGVSVALAWGYVGLRVIHSLVQASPAPVMFRFLAFLAGSLILLAMTVHLALAVF